jgi:exosortase K
MLTGVSDPLPPSAALPLTRERLTFALAWISLPLVRGRARALASARGRSLPTGVCALGIALGLKTFYSHAGATELLWILAPSAWLARFVGGIDLVYEQGAGFISHAHHLVVGSACAGVNFLVICFLCLYFSFARQYSSKPRWLVYSLLISFGATVAANGLRIFISAHLWNADIYGQWITPERMHRLAGIGIYYASLLSLYFAVASRARGQASPCRARASFLKASPCRARASLSPLLWYVSVSLGVPLVGRIFSQGAPGFTVHAAWVLAVAVFLTGVKVLPSVLGNRIHLRP